MKTICAYANDDGTCAHGYEKSTSLPHSPEADVGDQLVFPLDYGGGPGAHDPDWRDVHDKAWDLVDNRVPGFVDDLDRVVQVASDPRYGGFVRTGRRLGPRLD